MAAHAAEMTASRGLLDSINGFIIYASSFIYFVHASDPRLPTSTKSQVRPRTFTHPILHFGKDFTNPCMEYHSVDIHPLPNVTPRHLSASFAPYK